jgi:hypothetical protein
MAEKQAQIKTSQGTSVYQERLGVGYPVVVERDVKEPVEELRRFEVA